MMTIIILIGVSGCMNKNTGSKPSVKDFMMQHMEEKYNEKFEFVNINTETWTSSFTEMILSSEKYPGGRILVHKYNGTDLIEDNYVDFLMKTKIEEAVGKIVAEIYPKSKVFYSAGGKPLPNRVNVDMSIEDYSKETITGLVLSICVGDPDYKNNKDEKLEKLRLILEEKKYYSRLDIFYIKEGKLELINDDNWYETLTGPSHAEWIHLAGFFSMDDSYKFTYSEWRDIK